MLQALISIMERGSRSSPQRVVRKGHMTTTACLLCRKQKVKVILLLLRGPEILAYADIDCEVLWRETGMHQMPPQRRNLHLRCCRRR
jgi:hypothetical protein